MSIISEELWRYCTMGRYVRNDYIVFSGNDAVEYKNVCNGVYNNDENRIAFQNFMSEHMKTRQDPESGAVFLDCDFIDLDGILDTVLLDCDIDDVDPNSDFVWQAEKDRNAQSTFQCEENIEYVLGDSSDENYTEQYCPFEFCFGIDAA